LILDEVVDIGVGSLGISQFQDPGAVLNLVLLMQAGIVPGAGLPHFPKDFDASWPRYRKALSWFSAKWKIGAVSLAARSKFLQNNNRNVTSL
jgi:hypothetical protein